MPIYVHLTLSDNTGCCRELIIIKYLIVVFSYLGAILANIALRHTYNHARLPKQRSYGYLPHVLPNTTFASTTRISFSYSTIHSLYYFFKDFPNVVQIMYIEVNILQCTLHVHFINLRRYSIINHFLYMMKLPQQCCLHPTLHHLTYHNTLFYLLYYF